MSSEQHVHYADGNSRQESKKHHNDSSDDNDDDDYSQTFAVLSLDSKISKSSSFAWWHGHEFLALDECINSRLVSDYMSIRKLVHGHKKIKHLHLRPILFGILRTNVNGKNKPICILLDSGATGSFLRENLTGRLHVKEARRESWNTGNGVLHTNTTVQTHFILPELYNDCGIEHTFNVLATDIGYDMVIGPDLMSDLGLRLDFQNQAI